MSQYTWTFLGVLVSGLSLIVGSVLAHRAQKGTRENKMIDQQQEDIAALKADMAQMKLDHKTEMDAMKAERADEKREFNRRMNAMEERDRVYLPHILMLNRHIDLELGPPAPAIPPVIASYLRLAKEEAEATS